MVKYLEHYMALGMHASNYQTLSLQEGHYWWATNLQKTTSYIYINSTDIVRTLCKANCNKGY